MTPKQRVLAQIKHQETDFIPYTVDEGEIASKLDEYYGGTSWREKVDNAIRHVPGPDYVEEEIEKGKYSRDWYGNIWRIDLLVPKLTEPVLKGPSLKGYKFRDVNSLWNQQWQEKASKFIEENKDHFLVIGGVEVWETIWRMRGFENALMDVVANPEFVGELFDALVEHQMPKLEKSLALAVDGIMFADDWGMQETVMIGAERWRQLIKPRMARLYQRAHEAGKYTLTHCCGSIAEILPDVIEIGLDVYESVQPEAKNNSPYELKKKYGDKITFWGGLGSQSTIPFGTPAEIRSEVLRLCKEMGKGGGYIISPAKPFQPETPVENAAAVIEAFLEQSGVTLSRQG